MKKLLCLLLTLALCLPALALADEPAIDFSGKNRGPDYDYTWWTAGLHTEPDLEEAYDGGELAEMPGVIEALEKWATPEYGWSSHFLQLSDDAGLVYVAITRTQISIGYFVRVEDGMVRYYSPITAVNASFDTDYAGIGGQESNLKLNGTTMTLTNRLTGVVSEGEITVFNADAFEWRCTGEPTTMDAFDPQTGNFEPTEIVWFVSVCETVFLEIADQQ